MLGREGLDALRFFGRTTVTVIIVSIDCIINHYSTDEMNKSPFLLVYFQKKVYSSGV